MMVVGVVAVVADIVLLSRSVDDDENHSKMELTLLLLTGVNVSVSVNVIMAGWFVIFSLHSRLDFQLDDI